MSQSRRNTSQSSDLSGAFLFLLMLILSVSFPSQSVAERSEVVRFKSPHRSLIVVDVRVNGLGPYPFVLDTGATSSSLDPDLSNSLHLPTSRTVRLASLTDTVDARRVSVQDLALGPLDSGPLSVLVQPLTELKAVAPNVRGVLGEDVLLRTNYLIDNRKHRIEFDCNGDLLPELGGERIQTASVRTRIGGMETRLISVPVQTELSPEPLQLVLDSGADMTILQPDLLQSSTRPRGGRWIGDENGKLSPASTFHTKLTVGKSAFSSEVWIGDRALKHLAIDGLLPTGTFDQIYIGNKGSFVILDPRHTRHAKQHVVATEDVQ